MKKIIFIFLVFIFALSSTQLRAEEISLTLDEAIAIALRDNLDILLKAEDVKKAKEKIKEAQAGLLPTLTLTGNLSNTRGYYSKDLTQTTTQATLKQYLYKGGKIINTLRYNGYSFEVAQALLDKTKLETVLSVKKAIYALVLAIQLSNINYEIVENTKAHLDFMRELYNNGQASHSDILQMESSLSSVTKVYDESLNQIESAKILLNNLLFLEESASIMPSVELSYEPREVAFDDAFLFAMSKRPEIKQYQAQEKANQKSIEIAKADNRPSIYASWDYYSRSHIVASTTRSWNDYNVIGLTFSWPIFDGLATRAKVQQAIIDLKETQLTKEKTIRDIALELKNAYLDLNNAIAKINSIQSQIDVYKNNLSVAQEQYSAGIISSLDLSDISLQHYVSEFNQKEAIYDYVVAKARFDKAMGE